MSRCANADCPSPTHSELTMSYHWVQVHEVYLQQVGQGESTVQQHRFAAVACSKACAAAVLTAAETPAAHKPTI
ncbi:hypothetical protein [Actinomadura sp. HBU206391]|uniref:hypothetical protein n=1 Tax=Actinomadura sp. HBU206391 TaxID=2731692 RepID=UPI00164FC9CF|nr:hypothetical protein [Actinomadura sp. HBU206391]MBC6456371.1 hypothetical protein [Actinomadura sp. HBU206391]